MKYLVVIEDELLVDDVIKFVSSNPDTVVVAFSLPAKLALNKTYLHSYYPEEINALEDFDIMGYDNIQLVNSYCSYLDDVFVDGIDIFRKNKLRVFTEAFYQFKIFFDTVISTYIFLCSFFDRNQDRKIIVFKTASHAEYFTKNKNNIVTSLIEDLFCSQYQNIVLNVVPGGHTLSDCKKKRIIVRQLYDYVKLKCKSIYCGNKIMPDNALVLFETHDVALLSSAKYFHFNLIKIDVSDRGQLSPQYNIYSELIKNIFDFAKVDRYYRSLLTIQQKDLTDFFTEKIKAHVLKNLLPYLSQLDSIKNKIVKVSPAFLLTSFCRLDIKNALLMSLIKSMDVPVITYQEGGGAGYLDWPLFKMDVNQSDCFLVYGQGVADSSFLAGKSLMVPVGSIRLSEVRSSIKKKQTLTPTVVYVILDRLKDNVYQHYPNNGGFFSVAYKNQIKIIETLALFPDTHFIIKTVKELCYLYDEFKNLHNVSITTEAMGDVLKKAAGFIVEYPSTVFQEALMTDLPVALLSNINEAQYYPPAYLLMKKRAHICHHADQYYDTICFLLDEIKSKPILNNEFRDSYCIMNNSEELLKNFFDKYIKKV